MQGRERRIDAFVDRYACSRKLAQSRCTQSRCAQSVAVVQNTVLDRKGCYYNRMHTSRMTSTTTGVLSLATREAHCRSTRRSHLLSSRRLSLCSQGRAPPFFGGQTGIAMGPDQTKNLVFSSRPSKNLGLSPALECKNGERDALAGDPPSLFSLKHVRRMASPKPPVAVTR